MKSLITLAEKKWLPDFLIRQGIKYICKNRLRDIKKINQKKLFQTLQSLPIAVETQQANTQHYEVPTDFFQKVLGPRLKYSACLWKKNTKNLAEAEIASLEQIILRADIKEGMKILDLGCGWGSLSLWLSERFPNAQITSVSNSASQQDYIKSHGRKNITLLKADVNNFTLEERFDRIVSIEMFEHIRNHGLLLNKLKNLLAPNGALFVHIFCHKNYAYLFEDEGEDDWMSREFFTGGIMPCFNLFDYYPHDFTLEKKWFLSGVHYQKTADAWLENLDTRGDKKTYQKWRIFFMACSELFGFNHGNEWGVGHYLLRPL